MGLTYNRPREPSSQGTEIQLPLSNEPSARTPETPGTECEERGDQKPTRRMYPEIKTES